MKIRRMFISILICVGCGSNLAQASVDCPPSNIKHVQVETDKVLVLPEGQAWHLIGFISQPGTKEMLSVVLAAQLADRKVVVRYPDGYDCTNYDLSTPALMVRLYN
ncbi:hypothetical protein [Teredinibacter turnerae]|uniref:hypothetical protein n=1 Tax=Teredinibacter turnerae TaxID=2426 RepID=UPI000A408358|nr:hypothetical protein [Teredinibacter turnerae]